MKKKINYSTIIGLFVCCGLMQQPSFSAPPASNIIPQAGTINTHDMENLKRMKIENRVQKDFQNYEETKNEEQKLEDNSQKKDTRARKAPLENYATEGVYINNIEVSPSQILTEKELNSIIEQYTQTNLTIEQIKNIVLKINELYAEKGFLTARAYVPPQSIDNETIKIVLVEGKVGNINISETRWTRKKCIEKFFHLKKGEIFNISTLEQDILTFNRYNDGISLKGNITKGVEEETTDIMLQAEEKLPYTMTFLTDNQGRDSIGVYRVGLMLQAHSLTGHRDKLTVGAFKSKNSTTPFADYSIPVNKKDGRVGISYSYGLSQIDNGPYTIFNIKNRSHNYALYYYQPIVRKPWMEFASISSVGYKISTTSFDGYDIYDNKIPYVQTGLSFRYDTKYGIWYLNQGASFACPIFDKDIKYLKLEGGILRLHDFSHGVIGQLRANYQVVPGKDIVPYADQMTAGGMNTVRGYTEGLLIGKDGYIISAELQFPILPRTIKSKDKTKRIPFLGTFLKGFLFADHAGIFPYKGTGVGQEGYNMSDFLMSLGCGFKVNLPKDISVRLAWGFPLMNNSHEVNQKWGRFHFDVNVTPDFDMLLKMRKPKGIEEVRVEEETRVVKKEKPQLPLRTTTIKSLHSSDVDAQQKPRRFKKIIRHAKILPDFWNSLS